jgi:uncharacterized RDD family membrane protein YckC
MSKKNSDENNKAYFLQRLLAYVLDMTIVVLVSTLISYPFISTKAVDKLNKQSSEILEKYQNQEISAKTYFNQSMDNSYQLSKETGLTNIVTIVVYVLYFIVYQMYMNGQTIGKRIMKIRIVKNKDGTLSMNDMLVRGLINNYILANILIAIFVLINRNTYVYGSSIVQIIQYAILIASIFMIIIRKDGRSVADLICGTKVVSLKEE